MKECASIAHTIFIYIYLKYSYFSTPFSIYLISCFLLAYSILYSIFHSPPFCNLWVSCSALFFRMGPKGHSLSPVHQCQLRAACIPLTSSGWAAPYPPNPKSVLYFFFFAWGPLVNSSGNEEPTRQALIYLTFPAYREGKSAWKSCEHFPLWCRFYWTLLRHKKKRC